MAHLSIDEGKVYEIARAGNGNIIAQLTTDLKTQPQSFVLENGDSVLVTLNNRVLRIRSSGEIETLKNIDFSSLYPNSMAITPSGVIYVGMRLFIVRLVPTESGYSEEWLIREDCQKFKEKRFDCVCADL